MTPEQRGDLAERMVFKGARLAAIVHGDGGVWDVNNLIGGLDTTELRALAVVLAAMVDPGQTVGQALAHVTWDERFRPVRNEFRPLTLRQLADKRRPVAA
jgi:hypothetical protein